ncbi:Protein ANTAGONIST OF LIKE HETEROCHROMATIN PROTEIN 1 [Frankliniella fusca]|uniref:Protein ANTAGONIST OF LIKE HETEROCHROMATIN PROTEIN 1 n=1 Tax=Frankliniella fusca TaxID=407009 RepID=A0AAE1LTE4_9NEOP|nr:Protein ANTAGONIST OF LIKE HETEROCHROMATIN PROTEIN 1 [Frankliniella fusca]
MRRRTVRLAIIALLLRRRRAAAMGLVPPLSTGLPGLACRARHARCRNHYHARPARHANPRRRRGRRGRSALPTLAAFVAVLALAMPLSLAARRRRARHVRHALITRRSPPSCSPCSPCPYHSPLAAVVLAMPLLAAVELTMPLLAATVLAMFAVRVLKRAGPGTRNASETIGFRLRRLLLLRLALFRRERLEQERSARRWFRRPLWRERLVHGAWRTSVQTMLNEDPEEFFKHFRMTPQLFNEMLADLRERLQKRRVAGYFSPGERLAVTLYYLAHGSYMKVAGDGFGIPPSSMSIIVRETCRAIWEEYSQAVFPPLTEERLEAISEGFWRTWNFPNCYGAIDGKHCIVQNFPNGASDWFNYKKSFSMVLLAICDHAYKFTYVDIGGRGRRSDGGLWEQCTLKQMLDNGDLPLAPMKPLPGSWAATPQVLVADAAFPMGPNIMRPYPGEFLPDHKAIFNYRLSRARRVIENAFGIMTARWRVLRRSFVASIPTAKLIIQAVVVLHNKFIFNEENVAPHQRWYIPPDLQDIEGFADGADPLLPYQVEEEQDADAIREEFADFFLGPGSVPWQWEHLTGIRPRHEE